MQRVTVAQLQAVIDRLNRITYSPALPYVNGKAQPGCYHLSRAYGGFCLHRMANEGGGAYDVFSCGHVPARDLANRMHAFIAGLDSTRSA